MSSDSSASYHSRAGLGAVPKLKGNTRDYQLYRTDMETYLRRASVVVSLALKNNPNFVQCREQVEAWEAESLDLAMSWMQVGGGGAAAAQQQQQQGGGGNTDRLQLFFFSVDSLSLFSSQVS